MESIPAENSEVDEKGRHASECFLRIPTILRLVLENLSSRQLIRLSLVNKQWNYEARSVVRNRGNIRANISRGGSNEDDLRQKIFAFASDLEKMNVVPFIGLHIFVYHDGVCKSFAEESLEQPYKVILDRVPCKHFSVRFCHGWHKCKTCPAVMLTKRILQEHCGVLEELHLAHSTEKFLQPIFEDRSMPCLKSLTIESHEFEELLPSNYVKALVSCAPNLQQLHADRFVDLEVNVLEGSSAVLVPYQFRFDPLCGQTCEDLMKSLRAERMEINIGEYGTDPELLDSVIPSMLEASRTTITDLRMDLLFAVPLMCYGVCLENVTKLQIRLLNSQYLGVIEKPILELPKGLDFTRVFPKLKEVTIGDDSSLGHSPEVVDAFVEQGNALLSRALPDRAINIKTLDIGQVCCVKRRTLSLLAQYFPDAKVVRTNESQRLPFKLLREYFLCLERVKSSMFDNGL